MQLACVKNVHNLLAVVSLCCFKFESAEPLCTMYKDTMLNKCFHSTLESSKQCCVVHHNTVTTIPQYCECFCQAYCHRIVNALRTVTSSHNSLLGFQLISTLETNQKPYCQQLAYILQALIAVTTQVRCSHIAEVSHSRNSARMHSQYCWCVLLEARS